MRHEKIASLLLSTTEALQSLLLLRGKLFFSLAGVILGCASLIALVNIGNSAANDSEKIFDALGMDVFIGDISWKNGHGVNSAELYPVYKQLQSDVRLVSLSVNTVSYHEGMNDMTVSLVATDAGLKRILELEMSSGRFISDLDISSRHAVISNELAEHLKDNGLYLSHKKIIIGSYLYTVIGVLKPWRQKNYFLPFDANKLVIIPQKAKSGIGQEMINSTIIGKSNSEKRVQQDSARVSSLLQNLDEIESVNFQLSDQLIEGVSRQRNNFNYLLVALSAITMLGGGVGIMNLMITNVSSRQREIGLRIAVGARKQDILLLFMIEALLLSGIGTLIGVLLGIAVAWSWSALSDWQLMLSGWSLLAGVGSTMATGLAFGLWPAMKAAAMQPVEALREN